MAFWPDPIGRWTARADYGTELFLFAETQSRKNEQIDSPFPKEKRWFFATKERKTKEDFTLDPTGNWNQYVEKTSGNTDLNQSRTMNSANEVTERSACM